MRTEALPPANTLESKPIVDDITVVIPTLGRPILKECLARLVAGTVWPKAVIVVDQGAQPETGDWVESLQALGILAQHVPSEQRGRSAGINRGLERVQTRFVAVTDDDCFVAADWLELMTGHLRCWPEGIITGRVESAGDDSVEFCAVTSRVPTVYYKPQLKAHPLIGGNMGTSMEIVQRVGLFDEHPSLRSAEDSDWGYRALRLGIAIAYKPDVVLHHYNWRSAGQRASRYREYARSQGGFYGKYLLDGDWLIALQLARGLVRAPIRWLRGLARGDDDMRDRGRADALELLPGALAGARRRWPR
jgi:GT2 family glycosyltransferase